MANPVRELLATDAAIGKLAGRSISLQEAEQIIWNEHVLVANRRGHRQRRQSSLRQLLIGTTDSGRTVTLVIEPTVELGSWLLVTGWESTRAERILLDRS